MQFTEQDLDNLATLARITIAPNEKEKMLHDMQAILGYVSEINTISVEQTSKIPEMINVVRDDVITCAPGSKTDMILNNAPATENGYVKVTQVFG